VQLHSALRSEASVSGVENAGERSASVVRSQEGLAVKYRYYQFLISVNILPDLKGRVGERSSMVKIVKFRTSMSELNREI